MPSKKRLLNASRLSVIVTRDFFPSARALLSAADQICDAGATFIQLRDKSCDKKRMLEEAAALKEKLTKRQAILVINDHVDIARLIDADGVHLGQRDLPIAAARRLLGKNKLIGISCANLAQAIEAHKAGADYLGIGPIFATATKTDERVIGTAVLASLVKRIRIPVYAIGGINLHTIHRVLESGAGRVAVSSAICCAKNRQRATRTFIKIIRQ